MSNKSIGDYDSEVDLNYLGHQFELIRPGTFNCNICKCIVSYYTHIPIDDPNRFCQEGDGPNGWITLLSCDENIIKSIIE